MDKNEIKNDLEANESHFIHFDVNKDYSYVKERLIEKVRRQTFERLQ